jgi:hypothetical protein
MLDSGMDPVSTTTGSPSRSLQAMKYSAYLGGQDSDANTIGGIMNGVIKQKLRIIPKDHRCPSLSCCLVSPCVCGLTNLSSINGLMRAGGWRSPRRSTTRWLTT